MVFVLRFLVHCWVLVDQPVFKKKVATAGPAIEENLYVSSLSVAEKVAIALSVGEETLTVEELTALYTARPHPIVYDGFEPSGNFLLYALLCSFWHRMVTIYIFLFVFVSFLLCT